MRGPAGTSVYTSTNGLWIFRPSSITQDAEGAIWIGYWDGSACRIEGGVAKHFTEKEGLPATGLCTLAVDARKQLWFTQGGRVGVFRGGQFVSLTTLRELPICLAARRQGGMWVCSRAELFKLEEGRDPEKVADLVPPGETLEPLALFEDRSGAVWIGAAAGGLFRFDGTNVARVETSAARFAASPRIAKATSGSAPAAAD